MVKMRKLLSYMLTFSMLMGLLPTVALAEDNTYTVSTADDLTNAFGSIAGSEAEEATIVLDADINVAKRTATTDTEKELVGGTNLENAVVYGVPDCHITFKSKDENSLSKITFSYSGYLVGDITFDNVNATFPSSGAIYANGFLFEITDKAGTVQFYDNMDLYGGSDRRAVDSTHLILKKATYARSNYNGANIYGGGKGSGSGSSSMEINGNGSYTLNNPDVGDVKGNVTIELGEVAASWVVGGGKDANVGGDVEITYDGDGSASGEWISVITGAGHSEKAGYGHVVGDVTINANSGHVSCIYGTGWAGGHDNTEADSIAVGKARSVGGDVEITLGTDSAESDPTMQLGQFGNVSVIACGTIPMDRGWSVARAAVGGDIKITVEKSALFQTMIGNNGPLNVIGVGINSVCYGTVTMTNNGGRDNWYYSNETWNMYACYKSGQIKNQNNEKCAVSMYQNDGELSYLRAVAHKDYSTVYDVTGSPAKINGDVYTEVNGGEITAVYGRSNYSDDVTIDGDYIVKVTGGVMGYIYGATVERELTEGHTSTLTFDGYGDEYYIYYVGYLDDVTLTNESTVRLTGLTYYGEYAPLYAQTVKNLTIDAGSTLGVKKSSSLTGNLTVNGTLALARIDDINDKTQPGTTATITVGGTANGTGKLKPVSNNFTTSLTGSTPVYLEEYVYAQTVDSDLVLDLSPAVSGLTVNRKNTATAGTDVWFIDRQETYNVSYELDGGIGADGVDYDMVSVPQGRSIIIKEAPSKSGYTFKGWSDGTAVYQPGENFIVESNVTFTAQWSENSGGGGGSTTTYYYFSVEKVDADNGSALSGAKFGLFLDDKQIATATSNNSGIATFRVDKSDYRKITDTSDLYYQELTAPDGYVLTDDKITVEKDDMTISRTAAERKAKTVENHRKKTPVDLNGDDHVAYVYGYEDGTVKPINNVTRAETAAMLYRLLTESRRNDIQTEYNLFRDVSADAWYNESVSSMANGQYIMGYPDGTFGGDRSITRAEFVAMLVRFIGVEDEDCGFTDVSRNHWAYGYIATATEAGWIAGYPDGTFKPEQPITRAEAMSIINRALNRGVNEDSELLNFKVWPDNNPYAWYYYDVIEASNEHEYTGLRPSENWTSIRTY